MPEVSVVIPTYNSAQFLRAAVESVLAQTFHDREVIVIDDGSTDGTPELVQQLLPHIRYIRQANRGVSEARNRAIAEARGRWIAFLDADDTWFPKKLERQVAALAAQPSRRLCYSAYLAVTENLTPIGVSRSACLGTALHDLLTRGNIVGSGSTVLCDRAVFQEVGAFDPSLSQCADWDMWVRIAANSEFIYLEEPLVTYRQHANSMSRRPELLESDSTRVLQKGFASPRLPVDLLRMRRYAFARNCMVLAGSYYRAGRWRDFVRCAFRSLALDPWQATHLLGYPYREARRAAQGAAHVRAGR